MKTLCLIVCIFFGATVVNAEGQQVNPSLSLHWKNGDALSGTLLPSEGPWVSWDSPVFLDPLQVNTRSLQSIRFPKIPGQRNHHFRFTTISGDVFDAEIVGSDHETFSLKSQRFGLFQLNRDAVYSVHRNDSPHELFNGSGFGQWSVALGGPILNLRYAICAINEEALNGEFPNLSKLKMVQEGHLASSYFDLGISKLRHQFGMQFEGQLEIKETNEYQFHLSANSKMRFWIDDQLLTTAAYGKVVAVTKRLKAGWHSLKVEYLNGDGMRDLRVWWSGPGFKNRSLVGTNRQMGWREDMGGHSTTALKRTGLFKSIELPENFVLELELASSSQPRFIVGFGVSEFEAESDAAFKIETWGNDVVLAQGNRVESVQTIGEGDRDISIRLIHDADYQTMRVFEINGTHLQQVEEVQIRSGPSGIFIRNRGEDLIVKRASLYRHFKSSNSNPNDVQDMHGVQLLDGTFHPGAMHLNQDQAYVLDAKGEQIKFDLNFLGQVFPLNVQSQGSFGDVSLKYHNGEIVSGQLASFSRESVQVQTAISPTPISCLLQGAARLVFRGSPSMSDPLSKFRDQLHTSVGKFRGQLAFGVEGGAAFGWKPDGAEKALRIDVSESVRIERNLIGSDIEVSYELKQYPSKLFLQSGEVLPCEIISYTEEKIGLKSPYLTKSFIDSRYLKAIEFIASPVLPEIEASEEESFSLLDKVFESVSSQAHLSKEEKLHRILVNSDLQDHPPAHLVITLNGDLVRGKLIGISDTKTNIESKSRDIQFPNDRLYGLVDIQPIKTGTPNQTIGQSVIAEDEICLWMIDGSILIFRNADSSKETISGNSRSYGEISIPVSSVQKLLLGPSNPNAIGHRYHEWKISGRK